MVSMLAAPYNALFMYSSNNIHVHVPGNAIKMLLIKFDKHKSTC